MRSREQAAALLCVVALGVGVTLAPSVLAAPVTTTTEAAPPPTTTTTRATTTTTRATTSTTATTTATTATTEAPSSTTTPTTTPTTQRPASDADDQILTPEEEASTTTTTAPPPVVVHAPVNLTIVPGEPTDIPLDVDDGDGNAVAFDSEVAPAVTVNGTGSRPGVVPATVVATIDDDTGELTVQIEVPEGTPPQIVTVTIRAVDSRGTTRSLVYLIPVGGGGTTPTTANTNTTAAGGPSRPLATAKGVRYENVAQIPEAELPAVVKQIQAAIPDDATEQALLAELAAEPDSVLTVDYDIDDATLAVSVRPIESSDGTARGLVAAGALGIAAVGLIALRRRTVAVQEVGSR